MLAPNPIGALWWRAACCGAWLFAGGDRMEEAKEELVALRRQRLELLDQAEQVVGQLRRITRTTTTATTTTTTTTRQLCHTTSTGLPDNAVIT